MRSVIDLDGSFQLDPYRRDLPSLVDHDKDRSAQTNDVIRTSIQIAKEWSSDFVTFATGEASSCEQPHDRDHDLDSLTKRIGRLTELSDDADVRLALNPKCGDVIGSIAQFERFQQWLDQDQA